MSKDKVVYLIGAGASIGSFPIVKGTPAWDNKGLAECLIDFGEEIRLVSIQLSESDPVKKTAVEIASSLIETGNAAREFGNVDSFAKYLFHVGKRKLLHKLKVALTFYFVRKQVPHDLANTKRETRYLNFITSIISEKHLFPEHVKVLSWNYDYLLQNAASRFWEESFNEGDGASSRAPAFVEYYPRCGYTFQLTHKDFIDESCAALQLNGIAGLYVDQSTRGNAIFKSIFLDIKNIFGINPVPTSELLRIFHERYIRNEHLITFAWEKGSETHRFLSNTSGFIDTLTKDATILVVIGYSFPFYNREVDNKIFEVLKPTLRKIYFQDPYINGEFLRKRYSLPAQDVVSKTSSYTGVKIASGVEIEHINITDQFYIPIEV